MTLFQPMARARAGANSEASTVPELPAPAMPRAVPWCSGGYQRDASGRATAKEAPAMPSTTPSISAWPKLWMPTSQASTRPTITNTWPMIPARLGRR